MLFLRVQTSSTESCNVRARFSLVFEIPTPKEQLASEVEDPDEDPARYVQFASWYSILSYV